LSPLYTFLKGFLMKKFAAFMILSAFIFNVVFAAGGSAPTAPTQIGGYFAQLYKYGEPAYSNQDTMIAVDSTPLVIREAIDPQCKYVLVVTDSLGAADSLKIMYTVENFNAGNKGAARAKTIKNASLDTIVASTTAGTFLLPINTTVFGSYMTIKVHQMSAAAGIRSFIWSWAIYKLIPYNYTKEKI